MEEIKKHPQKVFQNNGLDVIIKCNMKIVNYLDVTFSLNNSTYRPFQRQNNITQYIEMEPNHPPNIIKQIPKTIKKHLFQLSYNEETINQHSSMKANRTSLATNKN